mgnify:CR=1 FL=1
MFKYNLKIALRNIIKYWNYSIINIGGLAIGLASFIFIVLYIDDEIKYDKFHEHAENVLEVIEKLKKENVAVYAIEQTENSIMLNDFQPELNKKYALIFGNEVKGVNQKAINISDGVIEIPQLGSKHSLNISVTAGIVIWDLFQKM